jgi:hypothetical protein
VGSTTQGRHNSINGTQRVETRVKAFKHRVARHVASGEAEGRRGSACRWLAGTTKRWAAAARCGRWRGWLVGRT